MADLPPLIDLGGFEARAARTLSGAEVAQFDAFVKDASAKIRKVAGTDFMTDDVPPVLDVPEDLIPVVFRVVLRAMENPLGHDSATLGDYTWRKESRTTRSGVYLTADDEADIRAAVTGEVSSFASVPLSAFELPQVT